MANLKKNGNLSGAIGNIVFVNDDKRTFARVKPAKVKQTPETRAAAGIFGLVSAREKNVPLATIEDFGNSFLTIFCSAPPRKTPETIVRNPAANSENTPQFEDPQGLAGFSFNPKMEWQSCTNFFPEVESTSTTEIKIRLPEIKWKSQIIPPKNYNSAVVTLFIISADLNSIDVSVKVLSKIELEISATTSFSAQEWVIPTDSAEGWLLLVGCVKFFTRNHPSAAIEEFSAAYLWAQQAQG